MEGAAGLGLAAFGLGLGADRVGACGGCESRAGGDAGAGLGVDRLGVGGLGQGWRGVGASVSRLHTVLPGRTAE